MNDSDGDTFNYLLDIFCADIQSGGTGGALEAFDEEEEFKAGTNAHQVIGSTRMCPQPAQAMIQEIRHRWNQMSVAWNEIVEKSRREGPLKFLSKKTPIHLRQYDKGNDRTRNLIATIRPMVEKLGTLVKKMQDYASNEAKEGVIKELNQICVQLRSNEADRTGELKDIVGHVVAATLEATLYHRNIQVQNEESPSAVAPAKAKRKRKRCLDCGRYQFLMPGEDDEFVNLFHKRVAKNGTMRGSKIECTVPLEATIYGYPKKRRKKS